MGDPHFPLVLTNAVLNRVILLTIFDKVSYTYVVRRETP